MDRVFVPESADHNPSRLTKSRQGFGVVQVNTRTLSTKVVQTPDLFADQFMTDGHGKVRIWAPRVASVSNRARSSIIRTAAMDPAGSRSATSDVLSNDRSSHWRSIPRRTRFMRCGRSRDGQALYRVSLDGSLRQELVLSRPDVDIDDVVRIGRSRRPVGVYASRRMSARRYTSIRSSTSLATPLAAA